MTHRTTMLGIAALAAALLLTVARVPIQGAALSKAQADSFAKKLLIIQQQGEGTGPRGTQPRRTPVTESELNSWFTYRAQPLLPQGVTQPQVTIVGNGKVMGTVTVDLEAIGKQKSSGGMLDPWALLGGRVPVVLAGTLQTADGKGRFQLEDASISGVPVPKALLQEILSYYSRTQDHPQGIRLDDPFALPANIKQIEVASGQAIVVQ